MGMCRFFTERANTIASGLRAGFIGSVASYFYLNATADEQNQNSTRSYIISALLFMSILGQGVTLGRTADTVANNERERNNNEPLLGPRP